MNPYLKRKKDRCHGSVSEKKVAKRLGGREQPASGAMVGAKGDVVLRDYLVEAKSTVNDSMSVKLDWLRKISYEALAEHKTPALTITFVKPTGVPVRDGSWVLIRESDYKELCL